MDEELRKRLNKGDFTSGPTHTPLRAFKEQSQPKARVAQPTPYAPTQPQAPANEAVIKTPRVKRKLPWKLIVIIFITIGVLGLVGGGYVFLRHSKVQESKTTALQIPAAPPVSIPVYYPKNLPDGYAYNNDSKAIKSDVLYFSVTGPKKTVFHITQQPIPASFDFVAFNKKFLNPDTFNTSAGTVTAGPVGTAMLGSVRTNKNTWIIINSSAGGTLPQVEAIARSIE